MARRIIFHISTDKYDMLRFKPELIDEAQVKRLGADHIASRLRGDSINDTSVLIFALKQAGFDTIGVKDCERCAVVLLPMSEPDLKDAKARFLKQTLVSFKELVMNMTDHDFTENAVIDKLRDYVEGDRADAVWLNDGTNTALHPLMSVIRNLQPDKTYYLASTTVTMC